MRVEVPDGSTLRDVLRVLAQRSNEFEPLACAARDEWLWGQLLVHVKGEMVRLDERLHEGDCLELLPPIAGGAGLVAQVVATGWRSARIGSGSPRRSSTSVPIAPVSGSHCRRR